MASILSAGIISMRLGLGLSWYDLSFGSDELLVSHLKKNKLCYNELVVCEYILIILQSYCSYVRVD